MNDDQLKDFLKQDGEVPSSNVNEWNTILSKIEQPTGISKWFKLPIKQLTLAFSIVFVIAIGFGSWSYYVDSQANIEQQDLAEFFLEDDYFSEDSNLYTWVDVR